MLGNEKKVHQNLSVPIFHFCRVVRSERRMVRLTTVVGRRRKSEIVMHWLMRLRWWFWRDSVTERHLTDEKKQAFSFLPVVLCDENTFPQSPFVDTGEHQQSWTILIRGLPGIILSYFCYSLWHSLNSGFVLMIGNNLIMFNLWTSELGGIEWRKCDWK